jgi:hypothetical protein
VVGKYIDDWSMDGLRRLFWSRTLSSKRFVIAYSEEGIEGKCDSRCNI